MPLKPPPPNPPPPSCEDGTTGLLWTLVLVASALIGVMAIALGGGYALSKIRGGFLECTCEVRR